MNRFRVEFLVLMLVAMPMFWHCSGGKPVAKGMVTDRAKTPTLQASDITTIISDSGITRYRITTPDMKIYDQAERSHWLFAQGLHFERFDESYKVDAQIDCKHAIYYDKDKFWTLKDSVRCTNISGEMFETNLLNWDEAEERIFSDQPIKITKDNMIINGIGFESNQMLTRYKINRVTGVVPIDKAEDSTAVATPAE